MRVLPELRPSETRLTPFHNCGQPILSFSQPPDGPVFLSQAVACQSCSAAVVPVVPLRSGSGFSFAVQTAPPTCGLRIHAGPETGGCCCPRSVWLPPQSLCSIRSFSAECRDARSGHRPAGHALPFLCPCRRRKGPSDSSPFLSRHCATAPDRWSREGANPLPFVGFFHALRKCPALLRVVSLAVPSGAVFYCANMRKR